ncbi:MAG: NADH-quinone oxidoreductase subunit C [Candidatus Aminicenantes bacterium]|nr:NADH-quinone oxidoreductase subunit C [Candidatus Aminicenantes bacterium]
MNDADVFERIRSLLGEKALELTHPAPRRIFLKVDPKDLTAAMAVLRKELGFTFVSTISGVDLGESFEILYHMANEVTNLNVRTQVPRSHPHVDSICSVIPGAILYEREIQEMFGLVVDNIPDGRRLLLSDDWPEGQYPMRKDWVHQRPEEKIPGGKS